MVEGIIENEEINMSDTTYGLIFHTKDRVLGLYLFSDKPSIAFLLRMLDEFAMNKLDGVEKHHHTVWNLFIDVQNFTFCKNSLSDSFEIEYSKEKLIKEKLTWCICPRKDSKD